MDFEKFKPIPIVQQKKKYANFTVREVSYQEILDFRAKEKMKEDLLRMKSHAREQRIAAFESESGQKLDRGTIGTASWAEKVKRAKQERIRLSKPEENVSKYPPWEPIPEPKLTVFQKIKKFFIDFYKSANF